MDNEHEQEEARLSELCATAIAALRHLLVKLVERKGG